jgi:magnesium-transporting ATPase (P-type)
MTTAEAIILFVCVFVAVVLMIAGSIRRNPFWAIGAFPAWILFAALGFMTSTTTWDFYYFMGWVGIMMFFGCALEAILVRPKKEKQEDEFPVRPTTFKSHMEESKRKRGGKDPYRRLRQKRSEERDNAAMARISNDK